MSDSLQQYTLQYRQTAPPDGQAISDDTGWNLSSTPAANATSASDSTAPPVWYRLKQTTANGVVVPFTIPSLTNVQSGRALLERLYGGKGLGAACTTKACVVDHAGSLIIVGQMLYQNDFGNGIAITSSGGQDMFVAKYAIGGECIWSKNLGNVSNDSFNGVAVDSLNNIYAIGTVSGPIDPGTLDFGAGPMAAFGGPDICLVKFSPGGSLLWMKLFGGTGGDTGVGIAIDSSDHLIITGHYGLFGNPPDFGGGPITNSNNLRFMFLAKLNTDGSHVWSKGFGGTSGYCIPWAIQIGPDGNPVVGGSFTALNANFGGALLSSAGGQDAFLIKYSGVDGSNLWQKQFGDSNDEQCKAIAIGQNNEVFTGGNFGGTIVLGSPSQIEVAQIGGSIFIVKYDANGNYQWSGSWGADISGPTLSSIALDNLGRPYFGGQIITGIDFGSGWLLGSANDSLIVALNSTSKAVRWALRCGPDYGGASIAAAAYNPTTGQMVFASDCGSLGIKWGNPDTALKLTTSGTQNNSWWATFQP